MPSDDNGAGEVVNNKLLFILIAIVLIPWGLTFLGLRFDSTDRGTFGDMFGAVNALFSGLAFAGLIYALLMQQKELAFQRQQLELQRQELKQNTAELKRSASAQEASEKALTDQIDKMVITSKLTALSSLLSSYDAAASSRYSPSDGYKKVHLYRTKISEVISQIDDDFEDKHTEQEPPIPYTN